MVSYRLKYSINGPAKYVSHLDVARVFERSMRRAVLPLAFSEGFNPHPKLSFGSALAVGVSSSGEYLEIELEEPVQPELMIARLNKVLPRGFAVLEVRNWQEKQKALMAIIDRAIYQVELDLRGTAVTAERLERVIGGLLARQEIIIMRPTKKGLREKNIRQGIFAIYGEIAEDKLCLNMLLAAGNLGNVRPEEVVELICRELKLDFMLKQAKIHREGLYVGNDDGQITSPLGEDIDN